MFCLAFIIMIFNGCMKFHHTICYNLLNSSFVIEHLGCFLGIFATSTITKATMNIITNIALYFFAKFLEKWNCGNQLNKYLYSYLLYIIILFSKLL